MATRRRILAATSSLAIPTAGCDSRSRRPQTVYLGSITVRNGDDQSYTLWIRVEDGDETVFETSYTAPPKSVDGLTPPVTGRGQYSVVASFEGDEYTLNLVPAAEGEETCVSVDWEISAGGMLASFTQSYTECGQDSEPTSEEAQ